MRSLLAILLSPIALQWAAWAEPAKQFTAELHLGENTNLTESKLQTQIQQRAQARDLKVNLELGPPDERALSITLDAPSMEEAQSSLRFLCRVPLLEVRPVHPRSDDLTAKGADSPPVKDYTLFKLQQNGNHWILLGDAVSVTEKHIKRARPFPARPGVFVELSKEGSTLIRKITAHMEKGMDRLAFVVDGKVRSVSAVSTLTNAFTIQSIEGGKKQLLADSLTRRRSATSPVSVHKIRQLDSSPAPKK